MDAAGGFFVPTVLSLPLSSVAESTAPAILPQSRKTPLKLGSSKETAFINHVDGALSHINRRYAKRHTASHDDESHETRGYCSFQKAGRDFERLVEIVWVSGTPALQISYLLNLASLVLSYLDAFPPSPKIMFRLLEKLDLAFASLIQGKDIDTGDTLPGFDSGRGVSPTEKVRIKSLVEQTRVAVVQVMNKADFEYEEPDRQSVGEADPSDNDDLDTEDAHDVDMDVARVYDRTLVELGDTLTGPSIGIPDR